ncbi:hypothetical protein GCM10027079_23520 [Sediminivirga luteola]
MAEDDDRHRQDQADPEPVPEHRNTVPGVLPVACMLVMVVPGMTTVGRCRAFIEG